jgi:hypothetical protein
MNLYIPRFRPAGFATLPPGVGWEYVEVPRMFGLCNRADLPQSRHTYGVIRTSRPLTTEEQRSFELDPHE